MFSFALPVMMGALGLVVDLGWAYFTQQSARAAAESAALAAAYWANTASSGGFTCGAQGVVCQAATQCPVNLSGTSTTSFQVACNYAKDNGFSVTSGGNQNVMVASNTGAPPTVSGLTVPYWVTVTVSQSLPQTFSAVLGKTMSTVSVRATATYSIGTGACVYVLDQTASDAIRMNGQTTLQSGCSIFVNSNSSSAVDLKGGAAITTTGGATTSIDGNWTGTGTISPNPVTGAGIIADPFASMTAPTVGSCTSTGASFSSQGSNTLNPGVYCGAISVSGGASLTLNPGTYILKNGISLSGSGSITGSGVTLYLSGGSINIGGTGTMNLSAPTSGTYQGILFYQDPSDTAAATIVGSSTETFSGVVYLPTASLSYTGGSNSLNTQSLTIVVDTLQISGNTSFTRGATSQFTPGGTGAALIE
jgi:Flp pilus assembly protein TadG